MNFTGPVRVVNNQDFKVLKSSGLAADFISTTSPTQQVVGINAGANANRGLFVVGTICATGGVTCSSDERLKTNITGLSDVLEKVRGLRGVTYEWREEAARPDVPSGERRIGVLAQDVQKAFPELVSLSGVEDYLSVDYSSLAAVLVEAVKELDRERTDLVRRIEDLENAMRRLESSAPSPSSAILGTGSSSTRAAGQASARPSAEPERLAPSR